MKNKAHDDSLKPNGQHRYRSRWITVPALVLLSFLLPRKKKTTIAQQNFKTEALRQKVDFGNIINSSFHANSLYDELKVKCHPDRFPTDKEKNQIAERLFQEITQNKTNINKLIKLKEQAEKLLDINF